MAKWYADDLRRKLLQAHDRGEGTLEQLAQRFSVSALGVEDLGPAQA